VFAHVFFSHPTGGRLDGRVERVCVRRLRRSERSRRCQAEAFAQAAVHAVVDGQRAPTVASEGAVFGGACPFVRPRAQRLVKKTIVYVLHTRGFMSINPPSDHLRYSVRA